MGYYGSIVPIDNGYHKPYHEKFRREKCYNLNGFQYENFKISKNREDQDRRTDRFAVPQGEVKLILSFEEAFFLCFVFGCLLVHDSQNNPLNIDQLWEHFRRQSRDFTVKYIAYHHIRSKGLVARCGLNYGVPYVGYYKGMSFYHSTFMFGIHQVNRELKTSFKNSDQHQLIALQREAGKVKKQLVVIKIQLHDDHDCDVTEFLGNAKVGEIHVTRFVVETSPENLEKIEKWKKMNKDKLERKREFLESKPESSKKIKHFWKFCCFLLSLPWYHFTHIY